MKNVLLFALLLEVCSCGPQNPSKDNCTLEGRSFTIENYLDGKLDGTEILSFRNGQAENDECTKYGFGSGAYTSDDRCTFKYTLTSATEGRMDWEGQVAAKTIAGKMVWIKAGQNDINYTFKGTER